MTYLKPRSKRGELTKSQALTGLRTTSHQNHPEQLNVGIRKPKTIVDLYIRSVAAFGEVLAQVPAGSWDALTPCRDWNTHKPRCACRFRRNTSSKHDRK